MWPEQAVPVHPRLSRWWTKDLQWFFPVSTSLLFCCKKSMQWSFLKWGGNSLEYCSASHNLWFRDFLIQSVVTLMPCAIQRNLLISDVWERKVLFSCLINETVCLQSKRISNRINIFSHSKDSFRKRGLKFLGKQQGSYKCWVIIWPYVSAVFGVQPSVSKTYRVTSVHI